MSIKRASASPQRDSLAGVRRNHLAAERDRQQQQQQPQQQQRSGGGGSPGRPSSTERGATRLPTQTQPDDSRWASRTMLPGPTLTAAMWALLADTVVCCQMVVHYAPGEGVNQTSEFSIEILDFWRIGIVSCI